MLQAARALTGHVYVITISHCDGEWGRLEGTFLCSRQACRKSLKLATTGWRSKESILLLVWHCNSGIAQLLLWVLIIEWKHAGNSQGTMGQSGTTLHGLANLLKAVFLFSVLRPLFQWWNKQTYGVACGVAARAVFSGNSWVYLHAREKNWVDLFLFL